MSFVFAAITPHPPMLLPTIGKERRDALAATQRAMERLEEDLYLAKPHIILIISPHMSLFHDAFAINGHTAFSSLFEHFGDLTTKKTWNGAPEIAAKISNEAKQHDVPVQLVSQDGIDHGASVPLLVLTNHLSNVKVLPIGYSNLSSDMHLAYGEVIKEIVMEEERRIAVIASGDLSHSLAAKRSAEINDFDRQLIELLEVRNTAGIAVMDPTLVASARECGYRSILIALGILKNINYTFKTYSYEAPFGIGYLVGNFMF